MIETNVQNLLKHKNYNSQYAGKYQNRLDHNIISRKLHQNH